MLPVDAMSLPTGTAEFDMSAIVFVMENCSDLSVQSITSLGDISIRSNVSSFATIVSTTTRIPSIIWNSS